MNLTECTITEMQNFLIDKRDEINLRSDVEDCMAMLNDNGVQLTEEEGELMICRRDKDE